MLKKRKDAEVYTLTVNEVQIEVTRKQIKTIRLRVNRVSHEVKLSSPIKVSDEELIQFIKKKMNWIKRHLSKDVVRPKEKVLEYQNGDLIPFMGENFTLTLCPGSKKIGVFLEGDKMTLNFRNIITTSRKEKASHDFYRTYLKQEIPKLIEKWEPIMGVSVNEFGVKRMKTRWGTCNIRDRRIWLSLALAEKPRELLEYVVVHEMVHLLERLHNQRFKNFMTQFLPNWKELQKQLNGRID
jgi:predicted metal-dependent hydrolase